MLDEIVDGAVTEAKKGMHPEEAIHELKDLNPKKNDDFDKNQHVTFAWLDKVMEQISLGMDFD